MNSNNAIFRFKKLTTHGIVSIAAKHNLREIVAEFGADNHIDIGRIQNNYIICGADTSAGIVAHESALLAEAEFPHKLRKDRVRAIELIFSLPPNAVIDHHAYFLDAVNWVIKSFSAPILSAVVHLDEAAPHCHVLILPLVDGKMIGSDLIGYRSRLKALHLDFYAQVASKYGLARPKPQTRLSQVSKENLATKVLDKIKFNPQLLNEPVIKDALKDVIAANPEKIAIALSIDIPQPTPPKARSLVQIMTKPQKKPKPIGLSNEKPIGFPPNIQPEETRTLSCVGFVKNQSAISSSEIESAIYTRVRDEDQDARDWNVETGEFVQNTDSSLNKNDPLDEVA